MTDRLTEPEAGATPVPAHPNENGGIALLHAWLSPSYPVGAYTYAQGLEWAVASGAVRDADSVRGWIADTLAHGAGRIDAILLAHACRAEGDAARLAEVADLAEALSPSAERRTETMEMGRAFADVTAAAWGGPEGGDLQPPYPVALGHAAWTRQIPLEQVLPLFLQAYAANLISAAVRLVPLGQTDGQRVLAALMPLVHMTAEETRSAPLDAVGGCAFGADIASMRHETQDVRLFRS